MPCRRRTRSLIHALLVGALLLALLPFQFLSTPGPQRAQATGSAPLSYVYDDLGRLEAVTDPASDTAIYHYDAGGNVTAITRQSSSTLALIDFSPKRGTVGSSVTLSGTAFSPTASDDTVQLNGTAATVTSATATQLVVSVPSGATSGLLTVTVGTAA